MQVALAQRVCLIVRQRCAIVLDVVPTRYLRSLLHQVLLELERGSSAVHLVRTMVHSARCLGRSMPRVLHTHLI